LVKVRIFRDVAFVVDNAVLLLSNIAFVPLFFFARRPLVVGSALSAVGFFLWSSKIQDCSLSTQWPFSTWPYTPKIPPMALTRSEPHRSAPKPTTPGDAYRPLAPTTRTNARIRWRDQWDKCVDRGGQSLTVIRGKAHYAASLTSAADQQAERLLRVLGRRLQSPTRPVS